MASGNLPDLLRRQDDCGRARATYGLRAAERSRRGGHGSVAPAVRTPCAVGVRTSHSAAATTRRPSLTSSRTRLWRCGRAPAVIGGRARSPDGCGASPSGDSSRDCAGQAGTAEVPFAEVDAGSEPGVEERLLVGVEYGGVGTALAALSPEMRAVVQAVVLDGLTTRETSRLLGVPENTVKTRLHRAKAHMRSPADGGTGMSGIESARAWHADERVAAPLGRRQRRHPARRIRRAASA